MQLLRTALWLGAVLSLLAAAAAPRGTLAQSDDDIVVPSVTRTFAIEQARVIQRPGQVLERATVVVRDGLITAVGPDVTIPFDAERIAGDSLVVYAGFIDGLTHAGVPKPKEERNQERVPEPGNPPNDRAGIQPERDVRTMLAPADKSVEDLRKAGFTVAHVVPYGELLPGSGAVVLLAGDDAGSIVLKGDASLFAQFETSRGVYPSTPMGVMAKLRQLYREAERRREIETMYAANATGIERPHYDPVHYAFFPVIEGAKPIVFYTGSPLDVHRVLQLRQDLGFPLMIAGLEGSFDAIPALQAADVPIFFTLKLPEEPTESAKGSSDTPVDSTAVAEAAEPMTPQDPFISDFRTRSYEDIEAEKENLEARQALARERHYAMAGQLQEGGIAFAFMTMDTKPTDIQKNLAKMIEYGLPEEAALAALTTPPAGLLGLSQSLGTVEPGKIANLVITTGPYFDTDSRIRYVFVDGQKFEIEDSSNAAAANEGAANPVGSWAYEVTTADETYTGTITISGSPGALTGSITSPVGNTDLSDVSLDGSSLRFTFTLAEIGPVTANLIITGDEFTGSMDVSDEGSFTVTGTRVSGPNR